MNNSQKAMIGLREMRYSYDQIRLAMDTATSTSTLCRMFKHGYQPSQEIEASVIRFHNSVCKRGDKIKEAK